MNASDYAAWYAAVVATLVLIWDVVKWRKGGPQIRAKARAGWRSFNIPSLEGQDLTIVTVTNVGDRATTITHMGFHWVPSNVSIKDKEKRKSFIVPGGLGGFGEIPKKIEPGEIWTGLINENVEFKKMLVSGKSVVMLAFSHSEEEVLVDIEGPDNNSLNRTRVADAPLAG